MSSWTDLERDAPELASLVRQRVVDRTSYLATVTKSGGPRVHPVTLRLHLDQPFVRMYPTSPKARDLQREARFALHSQVDSSGTGSEIYLVGQATVVTDEEWVRGALAPLSDPDPSRYIVFAFELDDMKVVVYENDQPIVTRWRRSS